MSYRGLGQALPEGTVFSLTDPDVAAQQPAPPAPAPGKPSGGGTSYAPQPVYTGGKPAAPITSTVVPLSSGTTVNWMPWAIGGAISIVGIGLVLAAVRR